MSEYGPRAFRLSACFCLIQSQVLCSLQKEGAWTTFRQLKALSMA
jgi:hypothetical protein